MMPAPLDTRRGRTWRPGLRSLAPRRRSLVAAAKRPKDAPRVTAPQGAPPAASPARLPAADRAIVVALMRYVPDLIRWARRCGVSAGDAPDVAQEVALQAWRKWETSERAPEHRAPWLFAFVARAASRFHRRSRKAPLEIRDPGEMEHTPDETPLPDEPGDERARLASLEDLRAGTTPERWRVFFAHEVEGVAVAAVAKREGIPLGTAYNRLRLARRDMRADIGRRQAQRTGEEQRAAFRRGKP